MFCAISKYFICHVECFGLTPIFGYSLIHIGFLLFISSYFNLIFYDILFARPGEFLIISLSTILSIFRQFLWLSENGSFAVLHVVSNAHLRRRDDADQLPQLRAVVQCGQFDRGHALLALEAPWDAPAHPFPLVHPGILPPHRRLPPHLPTDGEAVWNRDRASHRVVRHSCLHPRCCLEEEAEKLRQIRQ